jgi:rare lipoprotein A
MDRKLLMNTLKIFLPFALLVSSSAAMAQDPWPVRRHNSAAAQEYLLQQRGRASYYSDSFHGRKTATGETFSQNKLTAASQTLPLGSMVTVTNVKNGKSVNVKVNDRGPYVKGRIIDLSKKAAEKIGITEQGVAPVKVEARPSSQPTDELKEAVGEQAVHSARPKTDLREAASDQAELSSVQ